MEVKVTRIAYYGGTRRYPETSRHRTAGQPFVLKDVKDFSDQFMIIVDATPGEKKAAFANLKEKQAARDAGIKKQREKTGRISHGEAIPSMALPEVPKEKTKPVPEPGDPGYDDDPPVAPVEDPPVVLGDGLPSPIPGAPPVAPVPVAPAPAPVAAPAPEPTVPPADSVPPEDPAPPAPVPAPAPAVKPRKPVGRPPGKRK